LASVAAGSPVDIWDLKKIKILKRCFKIWRFLKKLMS